MIIYLSASVNDFIDLHICFILNIPLLPNPFAYYYWQPNKQAYWMRQHNQPKHNNAPKETPTASIYMQMLT
jgi:hypothetical protein